MTEIMPFPQNNTILFYWTAPSGGIFWYQTHVLVTDQEYNAAEQPGNGVCPGNSFQLIPVGERNGNITDSDDTPADQHGRHGHSGFCEAPENTGHAVGEGHQEIEQTDGAHMADTEINNTGGIVEKPDELGCKDISGDANQFSHHQAAADTEPHTLLYPAVLFCADILTNKGGKCLGKAQYRKKGETLQFGISSATGNGSRTEPVDAGLNHHIGNGDHGILHTGG